MQLCEVDDEGNNAADVVMSQQSLISFLTTSRLFYSWGQAVFFIVFEESCQFILADADEKIT